MHIKRIEQFSRTTGLKKKEKQREQSVVSLYHSLLHSLLLSFGAYFLISSIFFLPPVDSGKSRRCL